MKDGGTERLDTIKAAMKSVGGSFETGYFAFGEHDVYAIVDAPDHVAISAVSITRGRAAACASRRPRS